MLSAFVLFVYSFTTFIGLPSKKAWTLFLRICIRRSLVSYAAQAMCGVILQFFALKSGLSDFGGSVERTSTPAPAILPELSAAARACSSTAPPLAVLIKSTVGFIFERKSAFIIFSVFSVSGQCRVTMSDLRANSSSVDQLKFFLPVCSVS